MKLDTVGLCDRNVNKITWLHLSDLHFRAEEQYTWDENVVLKPLLADVRERIDHDGLRPDFVFVTGDIAFSGKPAEYKLARQFFDQILQAIGVRKDRLFLVPGNHDVDLDHVSPGSREIAKSLKDRESANAVLQNEGDRHMMMRRFKGYADFVNDYLGEHLQFDDDRYFYVRTMEVGGRRIAMLGLNTAWASTPGADKTDRLLLGERQARIALEQAEDADLRIALLHHPFDRLREFDRKDVEPLLVDNCDFVLHGHMHQADFLQARTPDSDAAIFAAGACYTTRRYPNSYNLVRLDLDQNKGTVYLRRYSDERGGFWAKDTLTYRNMPDGEYPFTLHRVKTVHHPTVLSGAQAAQDRALSQPPWIERYGSPTRQVLRALGFFLSGLMSVLLVLVLADWLGAEGGIDTPWLFVGSVLSGLGAIACFAIASSIERLAQVSVPISGELISPTCGQRGIDLAQQRLLVSHAFGNYFAGLLEREQIHINLQGQVVCHPLDGAMSLTPIERVFWSLLQPDGARVIIIAAEGGMGKSTLAAKIVRCLFERQDAEVILGDSAKTQRVEPIGGAVIPLVPGYYDAITFYQSLCRQLGLPPFEPEEAARAIRDRLEGRKAVIVVDNLETVSARDELLRSLQAITSRNVRAIVTTRETHGIKQSAAGYLVVNLMPLSVYKEVRSFLAWHIDQHSSEFPALQGLKRDLEDRRLVQWLAERTGGIPLLMQLVFSDVARFSWDLLQRLPAVFGKDLLDFLYRSRWDELALMGDEGIFAQKILRWIADEQYQGKRVTGELLGQWAEENGRTGQLKRSLDLLYERFLVVNHDHERGDFAVFPSLADFIHSEGEA